MTLFPEDLLELVLQERHGKQETKKVLTELQTSYDSLLHKYAAAENALDKVRFGGKPPKDSDKVEVDTQAEKVAARMAWLESEEQKQGESFSLWLGQLEQRECRSKEDLTLLLDQDQRKHQDETVSEQCLGSKCV